MSRAPDQVTDDNWMMKTTPAMSSRSSRASRAKTVAGRIGPPTLAARSIR